MDGPRAIDITVNADVCDEFDTLTGAPSRILTRFISGTLRSCQSGGSVLRSLRRSCGLEIDVRFRVSTSKGVVDISMGSGTNNVSGSEFIATFVPTGGPSGGRKLGRFNVNLGATTN